MKASESFSDSLKMEKTEQSWTGTILLASFVVLMGWYFLATYMEHGRSPQVQEKLLTVHDDLMAIDGSSSGDKTAVGKFGLILTTNDDGKTWRRRDSGTVKALSSVSFADSQHGFVVGSGGTLLATKDGGTTWLAQKSGTEDQLLGVHAIDPRRVFVVGAFGTLMSTSDGGENWNRHELKWDSLIKSVIQDTGYVEPNLNGVHFSSPEIGWIVGEFGLVIHTKDGGKTWVSQRYGSDFPQLYAVHSRDERNAWAVGQAGSIIRTTDGGQRWASIELESKRDLYDVSAEGDHGVVVGDGIIYVSKDGGSNWTVMESGREDRWLTGVMLRNSEAIAVGQAGTTKVLSLDKAGIAR